VTDSFALAAGSHTVQFKGIDTAGGDNTAFIDNVQFAVPPATVGDFGFEAVSVGTGTAAYAYNPSGSAWTFAPASGSNGSGVAGNGSAFTSLNPNAPQGTQVAFLQGTATITQTLTVAGGTYALEFAAAQRSTYNHGGQNFQIYIDSSLAGAFTPAGTDYRNLDTNAFAIISGSHTIRFVGLDSVGGDNTAFIDDVRLTAVPAVAIPAVPGGVSVVPSGGNSLTVSWSQSAGATSYAVLREGPGQTSYSSIGASTTASFTDTTASAGTSYSYEVNATNSAGTSANSSAVSATTLPAVPSTPTGLTGTPGDTQVSLSWTASTGATSYNIYRLISGVYTNVGTSTTPTFIDTGLADGTSYSYEVSAVNAGGESALSSPVTPVPAIPATPTDVTADAGDTEAFISWTASAGADFYNVYRFNGTIYVNLGTVTAAGYTDTGLTDETSYSYEVSAVNTSGESALSAPVSVTPTAAAIGSFGATAVSTSEIDLSWDSLVSDATSLEIDRSNDGIHFTPLTTTLDPSATTYADTGLADNTDYSYRIRANRPSGYSAYTDPVGAATVADVSELTATAISTSEIDLTWSLNVTDDW
jgi:fibronectin type 3 domain-containing protein